MDEVRLRVVILPQLLNQGFLGGELLAEGGEFEDAETIKIIIGDASIPPVEKYKS
jgi:hypothetical protein